MTEARRWWLQDLPAMIAAALVFVLASVTAAG
jgi:hypothetical protein